MVKLVNRAKMSTTTTGTGTITLGSAAAGYQSFAAAGVADGDIVRYVIEDGDSWEIGTGTYTAAGATLTRTVSESSNAGTVITLSGNAVVFVSAVAADFGGGALLGTVTSDDLDLSTGNFFEVTAADQTLAFSNPPAISEFKIKLAGAGSIVGYDLASASYDNISFSVASQEVSPTGIFLKPDGARMYVIGFGSDTVSEYNLGTIWDVSTATYSRSLSVFPEDSAPQGFYFREDGAKMYMVGSLGDDVNEYSLTENWNVTSAVFVQSFSFADKEGAPGGIFFKPDGTRMFVVGGGSDAVHQYDLSTAWDIGTATYAKSFSVAGQESGPQDIFFNTNGTRMFIVGTTGDDVNEYSLSTAWDIDTASYVQVFSVADQDVTPNGIYFRPDGMKMYIVGATNDAVYQYTTGYTVPATVTYPSQVKWAGFLPPPPPDPGQVDTLGFYTLDGGTTYYAYQLGDGHE